MVLGSDARWRAQNEEYIEARVADNADIYAIPGGPASFDWWNASVEEARAAEIGFRFLASHHALSHVWLIAHEGCAYCRVRRPEASDEELRKRKHEDLDRARQRIHQWMPGVTVVRVYASLEAGRVIFHRVG